MKPFISLIEQHIRHYREWDFLIFMVLTLLSVLNGQITVFYLIYFFWWNELIRLTVDRLCFKGNKNAIYNRHELSGEFLRVLFLMGIYWVFIVVFFGFIAGSDNKEVMMANMEVLFLQNWFFNINLIFVLLERLYLHRLQHSLKIYFQAFNPNTIVLHISIIVGGVLMFFVVNGFPETFTPQNRWGSVVIVLPFLLLKMAMQYLTASENTINKQNY